MFLSNFSINRPVATVVVIIGMMLVGLLALGKLRVNQFPDVEPPVLVVNVPYPGASPETVEREVVNRIEKALQSISGVDRTQSTSREGSATIVLIFDFSKNMIEAAEEVRNSISSVRYKLPTEIREPIISRADPGAQPILQLALSSTSLTHPQLSRLAEDQLAEKFRGIPGVSVVNVNGALRRELSILLRAEKLREFGVSVTEVTTAVRAQNTAAPVGKVRGELEDTGIRLLGRIESPAEFEQMIVKRRGTEVVRLGQVAEVKDGFAEMSGYSLRNGKPNVGISITRSRDSSTVAVADATRKLVEEIRKVQQAVDEGELARARAQVKASVLMSLESTGSRCEQLARQWQLYGRVISTEETVARINAVTLADIARVARRVFRAPPTLAVLGPSKRVPKLSAIADTLAA